MAVVRSPGTPPRVALPVGERARSFVLALLPEPFLPREAQLPRGPWAPRVVRAAGARDRRLDGPRGIVLAGRPGRGHPAGRSQEASAARRDDLYARRWTNRRLQMKAAQGPQKLDCFRVAFDIEKLSGAALLPEALSRALRLRPDGGGPGPLSRRSTSSAGDRVVARVLCHRDYHSRNLMPHAGRLYWIDFQDARMGPRPTTRLAAPRRLRGRARSAPGGLKERFRQTATPDEPREVSAAASTSRACSAT